MSSVNIKLRIYSLHLYTQASGCVQLVSVIIGIFEKINTGEARVITIYDQCSGAAQRPLKAAYKPGYNI